MFEEYINGTLGELERRARVLRAKIPRDLPTYYATLVKSCNERLKELLFALRDLRDNPAWQDEKFRPERQRRLRRIVTALDRLESGGITALCRANEDDHYFNGLLERLRREIKYPGELPTVSSLSQRYFYVDTDLNLMSVPLAERHFLLHLPDLYHELAHPLLVARDDSVIEPLQDRMLESAAVAMEHFHTIAHEREGGRTPEQERNRLRTWEFYWGKYWIFEFYCDLFATYTLGPAFAWSHVHLSAKRGVNPYDYLMEQHPADAARMSVLLIGLREIDYDEEAEAIARVWQSVIGSSSYKPPSDFRTCYPQDMLEKIAKQGLEGVKAIGCRIAHAKCDDEIHTLLNEAWQRFWDNPSEYAAWEDQRTRKLSKSRLA